MSRRVFTALVAVLLVVSAASAQGPFRWQAGQVLHYRVEQTTLLTEQTGDTRDETRTRLSLLKRWQVVGVEEGGIATVQLSLKSLRYEHLRPGNDPVVYDSTEADKAPADLRKQFDPYVGQPLATVRIDTTGKVIEVKGARIGYASVSKFENELAFKCILTGVPQQGASWDRDYQVTLEAGLGTGEKYPAQQHYTCKSISDNLATIAVKSEVKSEPKAASDQVILWQMEPEGEVVFDLAAGRLKSAVLKIDREQKGEQGDGRTIHFQSTYVEQYSGDR